MKAVRPAAPAKIKAIFFILDQLLTKATTKKYKLSTEILAGEYLVVSRVDSGISLNNTDDSVELYWPNDELVAKVDYTGCAEEQSYSYNGQEYVWTEQVTPGAENDFIQQAAEEEKSEQEQKQEIISSTFNIPPQNKTKQILFGLLAGGVVCAVALGVVGARYYKKKTAK